MMTHRQRVRFTINQVLNNIQAPNMSQQELNVIKTFANLMTKNKIDESDFINFVSMFPNVPDPVTNTLRAFFAITKGTKKEANQALLVLTLSMLATINPVFTVGQVILQTLNLLDQLFTTQKVIDIHGIQAVYTDKVRIKWLKKYHKTNIKSEHYGIDVTVRSRHKRDARKLAEQEFERQAHYKVYEVSGIPFEVLDPNFKKPVGRLNGILYSNYLQSMYAHWLAVNKKYFNQEEYDVLKRRMFETEQQKEFRLMLNSHGYSGSWFSKHADLDPYNFYLAASKELSGLSFGDQLKKFLGFFVC